MTQVLTFVTGNAHKTNEFTKIVGGKIRFQTKELDLPEFQGDPEEIAREKCKAASRMIDGPVVVQDDSLCFNALGGLPGPYIKWFFKKIKPEGLVKMLEGFPDKSAYTQCIFAFSLGKNHEPEIFQEITPGIIVPPRPETRYGWERIFQPIEGENDQANEEIANGEKWLIPYRSKALTQLVSRLEQLKCCQIDQE